MLVIVEICFRVFVEFGLLHFRIYIKFLFFFYLLRGIFRTLLYRFLSSLGDFSIRLLSEAISYSLQDKLFLLQRSLFLNLVTMQNFSTILKILNVNCYVGKSQLQFVRELSFLVSFGATPKMFTISHVKLLIRHICDFWNTNSCLV